MPVPMIERSSARRLCAVVLCVVLAAGCSGGSSDTPAAPAGPVASALQPNANGWSFPNFPSGSFPDVNFDEADMVSMFGSGDKVCVGGTATPCVLTAEAAAWAQMVNQARASGHCEGMVALAQARFNAQAAPSTVEVPADADTVHTVIRSFATQFLPEVQKAVEKWTNKSLRQKVDALKASFATGQLQYTLGVYVAAGGHALLPYAVDYPTPDVARIQLYDSNWPGKNRYLNVDLKNETWSFSFSAPDQTADPAPWTGGAGDMDLTPFDSRIGTCPFCGSDVKVAKNTLLIRSVDLNWEVQANGETVSPQSAAQSADGASATPVKGWSVTRVGRSPGATQDRPSYDYVVEIPQTSSGSSSTSGTSGGSSDGQVVSFSSSGTASVFAVTPKGIAHFTTDGANDSPVVMTDSSITTTDPSVSLSFAADNLVASTSGVEATLDLSGETIAVTATSSTGQVTTQQVTTVTPAVSIQADPEVEGGVKVLAKTVEGVVSETVVDPDGQSTTEVVDVVFNPNTVEVELPPALASQPNPNLPPAIERDLANPDYTADTNYVPQVAGASTTLPPDTTTTTTTAPLPTTTSTTTTTTTTTTPPPTTTAPSTTVSRIVPTLGGLLPGMYTFGDPAFTLQVPSSPSAGAFSFTSSNPAVATVGSASGVVTMLHAGSVTITATQNASGRYLAASTTGPLVVNKATPVLSALSVDGRIFGLSSFTIPGPTSASNGAVTFSSSSSNVASIGAATGVVTIAGVGTVTITATQASSADFLAASTSVTISELRAPTAVVSELDSGGTHSCVRLSDATVWCWGANASGELGDGTYNPSSTPVKVSGITNAVAISTGGAHSCALLSGGSIVCWGSNSNGQLGDGTTVTSNVPVAVTALGAADAVSVGDVHTCALLKDGSVWCWGKNQYGQLGNSNNTDSWTPAAVTGMGVGKASAVASGGYHTCVVMADTTAQCWGFNGNLELGNGSNANTNSPVVVTNLTNIVSLASGAYHSCAIVSGGTLLCWGYGLEGELGTGVYANNGTATAVTGITTAVAVTAGAFHTCSTLTDGSAMCWGYNAMGGLGDGTFTHTALPTQVTGLTNPSSISAGEYHTCAVVPSGAVRCWGSNGSGQGGDPDLLNSNLARSVRVAV